jgi:hypothetical protein
MVGNSEKLFILVRLYRITLIKGNFCEELFYSADFYFNITFYKDTGPHNS